MMRPDKNQHGIALMVVLWVLVLLMALATEFAFSMKTEVNTTRNYKEDVESYHLAKAGINLALAEIARPARFHSLHPEHGWITGKSLPENTEETTPKDFDIVERNEIPLGSGAITYSITDENGKIAINSASREVLVKVLTASGVGVGTQRDIIADSILDWIDSDDKHRLNGAESEYYRTQFPPYLAKNSKLETLEELLRVRGITQEILFGSTEEETGGYLGLDKFLTTYNVPAINPNTAHEILLPVLFDENQVEQILQARADKGFFGDNLSSHFRITSTGTINGSPTRHTIVTVVEKSGTAGNEKLFTHYWNDNYLEQ